MPTRGQSGAAGRESSFHLPPGSVDAATRLWPRGAEGSGESGSSPAAPDGVMGDYRIEAQIGMGGMGAVFRAVDTRLDRVVALKVLSPTQARDANVIERFRNEARAAARMDHENIARVYSVGEHQGVPYIAFEFVHGSNVRELIEQRGALRPADVVNYALQIASALRHTDAAGVVHRDIKPSNIIVTPVGRAKLVDMGLARKRDPEASNDLTVDGTTLGTFDYISPEQAKDPRNVDVRSDIYSLGCTLFHMLTGKPPYPVGTVLQKLLDHQGKEIPDAAEQNPRVPPELSAIVRRMMASDPDERYQSPNALIDDLSAIAQRFGLRPVPADGVIWSPPLMRGNWDLWKRYKGWIVTAAFLLLVVFVIDRAQHSQVDPRRADTLTPELGEIQIGPIERPTGAAAKRAAGEAPSVTRKTPPPNPQTPVAGNNELTSAKPDGGEPDGSTPGVFEFTPPEKLLDGPDSSKSLDLPPVPSVVSLPAGTADPVIEQKASPTSPPAPDSPLSVSPESTSSANIPEAFPFVINVNGQLEGRYRTLEAACAAAPENAFVELHYDGDQEAPQAPLRVVGKRLRIRAAKDYRPVLRFAVPPERLASGREETMRMISVSGAGASLEIYNIHVTMTVDRNLNIGQWFLFSVMDADHLEFHGVSVTLANVRQHAAGIIEHVESGQPRYPESAPTSIRIEAEDSFFRGEGDFIHEKTTRPARIRLSNVAIAMEGTLVRLDGASSFDVLADMTKGHDVELELKHVSAILSQGLAQFDVQPNRTVPRLVVDASDSVISATAAPLISMKGELDTRDFQERLMWTDDTTYLSSPGAFWQISTPGSSREYDRDEFDETWGRQLGGMPGGDTDRFFQNRESQLFSKYSQIDFQLDRTLVNPAIHGASDRTDAGVHWNVERLPKLTPPTDEVE